MRVFQDKSLTTVPKIPPNTSFSSTLGGQELMNALLKALKNGEIKNSYGSSMSADRAKAVNGFIDKETGEAIFQIVKSGDDWTARSFISYDPETKKFSEGGCHMRAMDAPTCRYSEAFSAKEESESDLKYYDANPDKLLERAKGYIYAMSKGRVTPTQEQIKSVASMLYEEDKAQLKQAIETMDELKNRIEFVTVKP